MTTPNLCPVCGARNDCSMTSTDTEHLPCWCYGVSIDPQIIRALPLEQRDQSCLCPRCANAEQQLPTAKSEPIT